jgi:hypothetical protein
MLLYDKLYRDRFEKIVEKKENYDEGDTLLIASLRDGVLVLGNVLSVHGRVNNQVTQYKVKELRKDKNHLNNNPIFTPVENILGVVNMDESLLSILDCKADILKDELNSIEKVRGFYKNYNKPEEYIADNILKMIKEGKGKEDIAKYISEESYITVEGPMIEI